MQIFKSREGLILNSFAVLRKALLFLLYILIIPAIAGCNTEGKLTGEIFVVTRGGENVKLGLVTVRAFDADSLRSYLKRRHERSKDSVRQVIPQAATWIDSVTVYQAKYEKADVEREKAHSAYMDNILDYNYERRYEQKKDATFEALAEWLAMSKVARSYLEKTISHRAPAFYFDALPRASKSSKTNADGEFEMTLDQNREYVLVARGERVVADSTEKYFWAVDFNLNGADEKHIMLSNDNLGGLTQKGYALSGKARRVYIDTILNMAQEGKTENWENLLYRLAFPNESTEASTQADTALAANPRR